MTQTLVGKIALVTGGSRGIGAATAVQLAAEGATVAFSYSNSEARAQECWPQWLCCAQVQALTS